MNSEFESDEEMWERIGRELDDVQKAVAEGRATDIDAVTVGNKHAGEIALKANQNLQLLISKVNADGGRERRAELEGILAALYLGQASMAALSVLVRAIEVLMERTALADGDS